ncbi:unnamed protein product [Paramecium pentaurelia]|uniref:RNA methyltransferase n=1 Tax=Paramecium pentaurelia TaxID=43138 RepID=A0A8S1WLL1_9CILI|nr:unnamed protein product [Paramecium pentaurelia]
MNEQFRKFLLNQEKSDVQQKKSDSAPQIRLKIQSKRKTNVDLGLETFVQKKVKQDEKEDKKQPNLMEKLQMNPIDLVKSTKQYSYGNYKKYYHLRLQQKWEDPRLTILDSIYFENKSILDIGCNDGTLTLLIALKHYPKLIRGIDIDYTLINKAIEQMVHLDDQQKKIQKQEFKPIIEDLPVSFDKYMEQPMSKAIEQQYIHQTIEDMNKQNEHNNNTKNNIFPHNVYFRVQNIIGNKKYDEKYDTILCLSITKWIHLNFGDIGIKRLFKTISNFLNVGGHLILEPQEWKSYKKKKYYSSEFKQNYKEIQLKPQDFSKVLEKEYNFKLIQQINPDDESAIKKSKSTFRRPILIFEKQNEI